MHPNAVLIQKFYSAFQCLDADAMVACYAPEIRFSDPIFTALEGEEASDMWRMLVSRAQNFSLTFDAVQADDQHGQAVWIANYTFTQTNRTVVNHIRAKFVFKNGKIIRHQDYFDLWKWARQALGLKGFLFGWAPFVQENIRAQASRGLAAFRRKKTQTS